MDWIQLYFLIKVISGVALGVLATVSLVVKLFTDWLD